MSVPDVGWLIQALTDVPNDDSWLSPSERGVLAGLRFPKRRNDWRLGRWTAKLAIKASDRTEVAQDLSAIEIRAASDGAPEAYIDGRLASLSISLSHSRDFGLCAVGPNGLSLGCDLEFIEPRTLDFVIDYFTTEEIAPLREIADDRQPVFATLIWSAKESVLKALREGLRRDTRDVAVRYAVEECSDWSPWTCRCKDSSHNFDGWWRRWNGYVQAIAADRVTARPIELQIL